MPRQGDEPVPGFHLQRRLGRGSFGEVWSAAGPGGTAAALKFIGLGDQQGLREFQAIQRIKQVRHAHLMPIIGIWLIDDEGRILDDAFLAQWNPRGDSSSVAAEIASRRPVELIEAMPLGDQDLSSLLAARRAQGQAGIPVEELLGYLEDAAKAIDFLNAPRHDLGAGPVALYHGDIKPQNIMLVGGAAQLCDFGLTRVLGGSQATSTVMAGTPAYIAPECIENKRPNPTTDQYSLAITYTELRTGALPFDGLSCSDVIRCHLDGTLDLAALPEAEREVIRRATARDPGKRFANTLEMIHELRRASGVWPGSSGAQLKPPPSAGATGAVTKCSANIVADGRAHETSGHGATLNQLPGGDTSRTLNPAVVGTLAPGTTADPDPSVSATTPLAADQTYGQTNESQHVELSSRRGVIAALAVAVVGLGLAAMLWYDRPNDDVADARYAGLEQPAGAVLPAPRIVAAVPSRPRAGGTFTVTVAGGETSRDTAEKNASLEYSIGGEGRWQAVTGDTIRVADLQEGELRLSLRAVDGKHSTSARIEQSWQVWPRLQPPAIEYPTTDETLREGDTLRVQLANLHEDDDPVVIEWRNTGDERWQALAGEQLELKDLTAGPLSMEFRSTDDSGASSESTSREWRVRPKNHAPRIEIASAPQQLFAGETLRMQLKGFDADGDEPTFQWRPVGAAAWQDVAGNELEIASVRRGSLDLEVRAVDGHGLASAIASAKWVVDLRPELKDANGISLQLIPAGEFLMGSAESKDDLAADFVLAGDWDPADEAPQHKVRITKPFYLGKHEVTKAEFAQFVADTGFQTEAESSGRGGQGWAGNSAKQDPKYNWRFWGVDQDDRAPVVNVTWNDCQAFCQWLSRKTGKTYRLPTEAEWEYAARAGSTARFANGDDPDELTNVGNVFDVSVKAKFPQLARFASSGNDGFQFPCAAGSFPPNAFGLYDMYGNVWEWCQDWYGADYYQNSPEADPTGPTAGENRVTRGGGWCSPVVYCRSALRGEEPPESRNIELGFRVVREP